MQKIKNLTAQQTAINLAINANPLDRMALEERVKVEDSLSKANFDLSEDIEVVLTMDEKAERGTTCTAHIAKTSRGSSRIAERSTCSQSGSVHKP